MYRSALVALFLLAASAAAQKEAKWMHPGSLYRAQFIVTGQPNHPRCGYWVELPTCDTCHPQGRDIAAFGADGKRRAILPIGKSRDNCFLVLVGGPFKNGEAVNLYWGAKRTDLKNSAGRLVAGLTVDIRTAIPKGDVRNYRASRKMIDKSERIGIIPTNLIFMADNPVDTSDAIIMEFRGYFQSDKSTDWSVFMANDDAGYFFFGDARKPVIDRSGNHRAYDDRQGKERKTIHLKKGLNPFIFTVIDTGGEQTAVLARYENARRKYPIPPKSFVLGGTTRLQKCEAKSGKTGCPAFSVRQTAYMSVDKTMITSFELKSLTGEPLTWSLSNGQKGHSSIFDQVAVGLDPILVEAATKGKRLAHGEIVLRGAPRQVRLRDKNEFDEFIKLMTVQDFDNLSPQYLDAYLTIFQLRERYAPTAALAEYLIKNPKRAKASLETLHAALAYNADEARFKAAHDSFEWLWRKARRIPRKQITMQYFEFELYGRRNLGQAAALLPRIQTSWGFDSVAYKRCVVEYELMSGKIEDARKSIAKMRERVLASYHNQTAARANNHLSQYKTFARSGFYVRAEHAMRKWVELAPDRFTDGHYALVRAQYCRRIGWKQGAYDLLTRMLQLEQLPAFLPDIQLERGYLLRELKRLPEAKEIFESIVREYPNHPAAKQAQKML